MNTHFSKISVFKRTIILLCSVGVISLALFNTCAFAAPLHQVTGFNSNTNALNDSTIVQTKLPPPIHSGALLHDACNGAIIKSHMYNLVSHQDNADKQDSQTAILSAGNQSIAFLNAANNSNVIGYIVENKWITSYTDVDDFVNDINDASSADVYLNQDIALNNIIVIKDEANITIDLCGHVLSGKKINTSGLEDAQIIDVGNNATLNIMGSENDEQASQAHSLYGFNEKGEKQLYDNVYGGAINADGIDNIGGIFIYGNNSVVTLNNTTIFGCSNKEREGAGIKIIGENTQLYLNNSHIQHCRAYRGGGIFIDWHARHAKNRYISMVSSSIDCNYASDSGGGIYNEAENVTIENTIYNPDDETTRSTISNNTAEDKGGGIFCNAYGLKVYWLSIINNQADKGGGAYVSPENNTFDGCTFTCNTSTEAGSAFYDNNDDNTLKNCTITDNCSKNNKGAVFVHGLVDITLDGTVTISNNTGCDVYLPGNVGYIEINPETFNSNSRIGIYMCYPPSYSFTRSVCVQSTNGIIPEKIINCFFVDSFGGQSSAYKIGYDRYWWFGYKDDKEELAFIEK